jgi:hypothetical protein
LLLSAEIQTESKSEKITPQYFFDHYATQEETRVTVELQDFLSALQGLKPSVTEEELNRYKQLRDRFTPNHSTTAQAPSSNQAASTNQPKRTSHSSQVEKGHVPSLKGKGKRNK